MEEIAQIKNKIISWVKDNYWLLLILSLAFGLRWYGIYFDYPYGVSQIWDESYITNTLDMLQYKSIFTPIQVQTSFFLPILYLPGTILRLIYLAIVNGIYNLNDLKEFIVVSGSGTINIVARFYSVAFGVASTLLIYKIYLLIFNNKKIVYFAVLAYAVSFIPIYLSHWGKAHISVVFFLLLALYFALKYERDKNIKHFYWCCLFATLSFLAHYVGMFTLIYPAYTYLLNRKNFKIKQIVYSLIMFIALVFVFYILNWQGLQHQYGNAAFLFQQTGFKGMFPVSFWFKTYYLLRDSFRVEYVFFSIFCVMFLINLKRLFTDRLLGYITLGIVANYLFLSFIIVGPEIARLLLVFITLAVPLGAALLMERLENLKLKNACLIIFSILIIVPNLYFTGKWLSILNNNTRKDLTTWAEKNLNKDENIYTFDLYFDALLSYKAALFHREENKVLYSKKLDYIIDHQAEFENKGLNIFYDIGHNRYKELGGKNTKYFVISYWVDTNKPTRLPDGYDRQGAQKVIDQIRQYHEIKLEKTFYPTENKDLISSGVWCYLNNPTEWKNFLYLDKGGPFVEVYKVIK